MIDQILANETVMNAIMGAIALLITTGVSYLGMIIRKFIKDEETAKQITSIVDDAVNEVYEEFVKDLKASAADGKLTASERKAAMIKAQVKIKEKGKKEGIDVAKTIGQAGMRHVIEGTIQKFKTGGVKPLVGVKRSAPTIDVSILK